MNYEIILATNNAHKLKEVREILSPHKIVVYGLNDLNLKPEDAEENAKTNLEILKQNANLFVAKDRKKLIEALKQEMMECAERLEYEQAAAIRDQITEIEKTYGKASVKG